MLAYPVWGQRARRNYRRNRYTRAGRYVTWYPYLLPRNGFPARAMRHRYHRYFRHPSLPTRRFRLTIRRVAPVAPLFCSVFHPTTTRRRFQYNYIGLYHRYSKRFFFGNSVRLRSSFSGYVFGIFGTTHEQSYAIHENEPIVYTVSHGLDYYTGHDGADSHYSNSD